MKKTNKILSVILAFVMIFSVSPMAFAAPKCEHANKTNEVKIAAIPDSGKAFEDAGNIYEMVLALEGELEEMTLKYSNGSYVCADCGKKITVKRADYSEYNAQIIKASAYFEAIGKGVFVFKDGYSPFNFVFDLEGSAPSDWSLELPAEKQTVVDEYAEYIKTVNEEFESNIEANGISILETWYARELLGKTYGSKELETVFGKVAKKYQTEVDRLDEEYGSMTQGWMDAYVVLMKKVLLETEECLSGEHGILKDEVKNEDGTYTGTCSNCGDEVTVKNPKTPCKYCDGGHNNFFDKIVCFFKNIIEYLKSLISSFGK